MPILAGRLMDDVQYQLGMLKNSVGWDTQRPVLYTIMDRAQRALIEEFGTRLSQSVSAHGDEDLYEILDGEDSDFSVPIMPLQLRTLRDAAMHYNRPDVQVHQENWTAWVRGFRGLPT